VSALPVKAPSSRAHLLRPLLLYPLLVITLAIFAIPLYWLFSTALKAPDEIYTYPVTWLPLGLHWENFAEAWRAAPFDRFLINSVITTSIGTVLELVLAIMSAYAFAFVPFRWKRPVLLLMLGSLMLPGHVTLLVNYITIGHLGWINTYQGLILPGIGTAFAMFLLLQQMRRISAELVDAMTLDGAGHLYRLLHLVLPLSRPMIITATLIVMIGKWNDFVWPLIATNTVNMRTLPIGLMFLRSEEGYTNWGAVMAGTVITALPMLIIFFLAQRRIVGGLAAGALR
jgi:multiple sugar transport system permease protein/sn-glycerol 3-phosphate transport system permease protein